MASPSEAEVQAQISNASAYYLALLGWGKTASPNLLGLEDTLVQSLEGDWAPEVTAALRGIRGGFGGLIRGFRAVLDPLWLAYGKVKGYPERTPEQIIDRLYDAFAAAGDDVNAREFTFGSVSAGGSNVGTGTIQRLTKDENNFDIESYWPETRTITCIQDAQSGVARHEERFEIRGAAAERDGIVIAGSGLIGTLQAVSSRNSLYVQNPSFDTLGGNAISSLTSIPGWTYGTVGNFQLHEANVYRSNLGAQTARALRVDANDYVSQNLNTRRFRNPTIDGILAPMYLQVAWNREVGSGAGATITLTLGSQTASVAVGTTTGWNVLRIAVGQKNWFKTWNQNDALVKVAVTGLSSGYVLLDDVVFVPFQRAGGGWYLPVGGATPFVVDDTFSFADSIASDSKIQRVIAQVYRRYLPPDTGGTETWSDPA